MTKKDFECQVHTRMMKNAKSRVYKGGTLLSQEDFFDTKIQYLGPRSDQFSFLHSINSLFGLCELEFVPVLDQVKSGPYIQLLQFYFNYYYYFITMHIQKFKSQILQIIFYLIICSGQMKLQQIVLLIGPINHC